MKERTQYKKCSYRLSPLVEKELKKQKEKQGVTFNIFLAKLLGLKKAYDKED